MNQVQMITFLLLLLRVSSFVLSAGVFSVSAIPPLLKILFSLSLALILYPILPVLKLDLKTLGDQFMFLAIQEVVLGLVLGLTTRFFFYVMTMVGDLISTSMGLGSSQQFNPLTGSATQVMEQFFTWMAFAIFLSLGGHRIFIEALFQSFQEIPLAAAEMNAKAYRSVFGSMGSYLTLAIQLAAPVVISALLANVTMGILGRAVPQMNVLVTSFPVSILICLGILIIGMPYFSEEASMVFGTTMSTLMSVMREL